MIMEAIFIGLLKRVYEVSISSISRRKKKYMNDRRECGMFVRRDYTGACKMKVQCAFNRLSVTSVLLFIAPADRTGYVLLPSSRVETTLAIG
jgi:hypothetical protein